jgi:cysteinyl-tRNA synthetase
LVEEESADITALIETMLGFYAEAKAQKDYAKIDVIRAKLKEQGIAVKDMKDGIDWAFDEN